MSDQCFLRLELVGQNYVVVDQDGRKVHGVQSLKLDTEQGGGCALVTLEFMPFGSRGERIK